MTLRALVVTHYFAPHVGGIETVAAEHLARLPRRGWQVELFTTRLPSTATRASASCRRFPALNVLEDRLGVPVPVPTPAMLPELVGAAARADVVIAHGHVYPTSVLAAVAARRARRPFVVIQHNPFVDFGRLVNGVERLADATIGRWVLRTARKVVCVSRYTERHVRRIEQAADTVVVPNGVDTDRFRAETAPSDETRRVVTLRRLVPRNGVHVLLDAWDLAGIDDRAELVIGGTGPAEAELRRVASDLPAVRFAGRVPEAGVVDFYRGAWVAVMPTVSGEGFGLMAAEAMACGVPVIASAQGALPETVRDDRNGVLVHPDDPLSLARAMRTVVDDPPLRARLAAGAVSSAPSWDRSIDLLDDVLRGVIGDTVR